MLEALGTALLSYIGTTSDYFVILLLMFGMYRGKLARPVVIGAYLGNGLLLAVAIIVAYVLKLIPAEWLLGLLGLIPIYMGIRTFFADDDEVDEAKETLAKASSTKIISNVVLITVTTCGADNLAMYIPFFANTPFAYLPAILGLFLVILTVIIFAAYRLTLVPAVHQFFAKFGETTTAIIYIALGLYVLWDAGTITHILALI
ncbi:cadmium resistance transporter [Lentilactobacillus senioris]|nr:cadmium resistance transporter [Lentilactobacillus senioris]